MKITTISQVLVSLLIAGSTIALPAYADEWNELTKVTLAAPVEIPGQVLTPGTYWFKLLDSQTDRNVVQIFNADRSKEIAMLLAIPDYRLRPTGKTVITFEERAANAPEAIKAWFYPGMNYGQEFVYPKPRAMQLAKASNQPVPSMPANLEADTKMSVKSSAEAPAMALKKAPVKAQQPSGEEMEVTKVFPAAQAPAEVAQNTAPAPAAAAAPQLPKTASTLPSWALAGFLFLSAGLVLRLAGNRLS